MIVIVLVVLYLSFVVSDRSVQWEQITSGGRLKQVSTNDKDLYGTNSEDGIWRIPRTSTSGIDWVRLPGYLSWVSTFGAKDKGSVWGVNKYDQIFCYLEDKNDWLLVGGQLIQISVGPSGVWGVNRQKQLFYRKNVGCTTSSVDEWIKVSGTFKHVSVGRDRVVALRETEGKKEAIEYTLPYDENSKPRILNPPVPLKYIEMSYIDGSIVGTSEKNKVYYSMGEDEWEEIQGQDMKHVVPYDGYNLYGVNAEDKVFQAALEKEECED